MHDSTSRTCACRAAGLAGGVGMRCCPLGTTPRTLAPIHSRTPSAAAPFFSSSLFFVPPPFFLVYLSRARCRPLLSLCRGTTMAVPPEEAAIRGAGGRARWRTF
ncbi:hypothetical protein ACQJBY_010069 [Aegilops geniculata]